ncbi:MAG: hypothetical protein VYE73_14130 [Acidobacteriota bacterium]|nr:hypothetical protein [Acidobacteriota bacterium]
MRASLLVVTIVVGAIMLAGCGPQLTPEEKVEVLRSQYSAELTSLTVLQDPQNEEAEPAADKEGGAAELDTTGLDLDQPALRTDVVLDILVSTTSQDYLSGITIDLQHVDGERNEKSLQNLWVDTSSLIRGGGTQVSHVLEDVDYVAGDGFWVEVRSPVGIEERPDYREFSMP